MGLFDKLIGKLKGNKPTVVPPELIDDTDYPEDSDVILTPVQNADQVSEQEDISQKDENPKKASAAYSEPDVQTVKKFRSAFRHHFPTSLSTVECQMQLPYMVSAAFDISPVIEYASANYKKFEDMPEKLAELGRANVAKVAMAMEKYLSDSSDDSMTVALSRAQNESLEKAWIVLDFYCQMLKADFTQNIKRLYLAVSEEIIARGVSMGQQDGESYEDVLAECSAAISKGVTVEKELELRQKLFAKLMTLDSLYVICDAAFNSSFPYVGADGRLELQTNAKRAEALKNFLLKNGDCKVSVSEYKTDEFEDLFSYLLHNGLTAIRIDNGSSPVEIELTQLYDNGEKNLLECCNRYARGMFIRELQYGYTLKDMDKDAQDSENFRAVSSAMLSARTNGYRALAGGLYYAFNIGGEREGVTLYTPKALEKAKEIMKVMGIIDDSVLIAPGDTAYEVFEGELELRTVQKKSASAGEGLVCAFTDKQNTDIIRKHFAGSSAAPIVVTAGELCNECASCAGFILDMASYGIEIPGEVFLKIGESVKSGGQIIAGKEV